jgi:hypothetical protein
VSQIDPIVVFVGDDIGKVPRGIIAEGSSIGQDDFLVANHDRGRAMGCRIPYDDIGNILGRDLTA